MKLAPLLAQFLFINKRLDLPGIGIFLMKAPAILEEGNNAYTGNISFENNPTIKESPALINFISAHTGKMKALAMADLDSHLELAREFLNIGKPFLFEGIGSLVKIRSGEFAFTSGETISDKIKEYSAKEISSTSSTEESFADIYSKDKKKWRKVAAWLLLLAGVGVAIWGGYTIYQNKVHKDSTTSSDKKIQKEKETELVSDSTQLLKTDSTITKQKSGDRMNYKFVVEVANKQRGEDRFATLKGYGLDIKMETTDSISFKLFFLLPATPADTTRMIDSLKTFYTPSWGKAFVEN